MSTSIPFRKMNGLGNEIVVVDLRRRREVIGPEQARAVGRTRSSHFDQMMVLDDPRTPGTEAYVRIFNADGSPAEACGNGMRCVGWVVAGETGRKALKFETAAGLVDVRVADIGRITVDMGRPRFGWRDIPLGRPADDTTAIALQVGPAGRPLLRSPSVVNVGNPHAVFWVDDVEAYDLGRIGPQLERNPIFPERANISLAHVTSPVTIALRTWERGAGLTRACGSAACAAVVCAARKGLTGRQATVTLPGGQLAIEWRADDRILMTGPAEVEHEGVLDLAETAATPHELDMGRT
jgi:diaminopimelate epimerase